MNTSYTPSLYGRNVQLDALREAVNRVGRPGRMVVVRGLPGSGRSAVVRAAITTWRADGLRVAPAPLGRTAVQVVPGTVLVADDTKITANALLACRRPGCLLVATCQHEDAEVAEVANDVVDLPPLDDDAAGAILREKSVLDEAAIAGLRGALGPWFGNPGTLLAVVDSLVATARLVRVHDRLCLANPDSPIPLPAEHSLLRCVNTLGVHARAVLSAVAAIPGVDLADLLAITGYDPTVAGPAVDALVECGVLLAGPCGQLRCCCPALETTVLAQAGLDAVRDVKRSYASHLLNMPRSGQAVDRAVLADHVVGSDLRPADVPSLAGWLMQRVSEFEHSEPERAIHWSVAARRLGANVDLPRLALQTGQYRVLLDTFKDDLATVEPGLRWDLAVAAMLAEMDGGEPTPELAEEPPCTLAAWWLGRRPSWEPVTARSDDAERLMSTQELNVLYHALSVQPRQCAQALASVREESAAESLEDLIEAGAASDIATVVQTLLGNRFRSAKSSVLGLYQEVVRSYIAADWPMALQAARQLELVGSGSTPCHQFARMFAAAIHAARGDLKQAEVWISTVSRDVRYAVGRSTVECTLLHRRGKSAAAVNLAWRTAQGARVTGARPGLGRLLLQGLQIALRNGDTPIAAAIMDEIEELHQRDSSRSTLQMLLLGRGLRYGDVVSAAEGAAMVRQRGHRPDLLWACQILARFCDDPRHVITELHAVAEGDGSFLLPAQIDSLLHKFGMPPVRTASKPVLSPSDLRIVGLIGAGQTNRQIAALLGVSEKTVEHYLTKLFVRTGCRSRVELAAASLDGRLSGASQ